MLILPITILATSIAIFFRPFARIVNADYDMNNAFVENMIEELK